MNEFYDEEIERLHEKLAALYRGKSTDYSRINQIWARIERLEATKAKIEVREAAVNG